MCARGPGVMRNSWDGGHDGLSLYHDGPLNAKLKDLDVNL